MNPNRGFYVVGILLFCIWVVLFVTILSMQLVYQEQYQEKADNRARKNENIFAERGKIVDRNGIVLANILLKRDSIGRKGELIRIPKDNVKRIYLHGELASQIIGKVGHDGKGSMGLERQFNEKLKGRVGYQQTIRDARSHEVYGQNKIFAEPQGGNTLVLTLDVYMQEIVETALKQGAEEFKAVSASAVVLDPTTGNILAAATYPTFDPNSEVSGSGNFVKSDVFTLAYEPGSTFKVITALAALEKNVVDPDSVFDDEGGKWEVVKGDKPIKEHDGKDLGPMNMQQMLVKSSNIVAGKIAQLVGNEPYYKFVRNFGFGVKTSNEIIGEEKGLLKKPHNWSLRTLATLAFGHELLVTPIQMAMAYVAVANDGDLMQPRLIAEWQDAKGNVLEKKSPVKIRRMVTPQNASKLRDMLKVVVDSGTAMRVNSKIIPEIKFGGKTGTAEKYDKEQGKYDRHSQIASFIGLAPALNPQYVCLVLVDDPKTRTAGGTTAGPIFRRIMERIYSHPKLSPASFRVAQSQENKACRMNLNGSLLVDAEKKAAAAQCKLGIQGNGEKIISTIRESNDSLTVVLGEERIQKMPNLVGLSLKEALAVLGKARLNVEISGRGRVEKQMPLPETVLESKPVCKLVLKENT